MFDSLSSASNQAPQPFNLASMSSSLPPETNGTNQSLASKRSAQDFLGGNSDLVNLDNLVTPRPTQQQAQNPFVGAAGFSQPAQNQMSLNQMKGVNTPVLPAAGTTVMPTANPLMATATPVMSGPYPNQLNTFGYQSTMQPNFGMPVANPTMPMANPNMMPAMGMGVGMGLNASPNMASGMGGGQMSNNPFL